MDQLLYGILLSDKANAIKCKVVDQFRKAGCRKQAVKDVHGVLNCCKRFILERKDDQQILLWSKQIFSAWASCNYNAFEEYFSAALTDELFVFGHSNVAGALWIIQEGLRILQTHQLQTYIVVCSYVGQRAANFIRDNSDFTLVVDFCQILLEHPECLPPSSSSLLRVFCSTLLRVVSQFDVPTDDEKSSYFLCNVPNVIGMLLQRIWLQNKESLENSLRTVFDVICSCNKTTGIKAIGAVVQFIPNEVMQAAVWSEATATKLDDQQVMDLLDRMILMLTWPHIKQADAWIVCYMRGLASAGRYMMLSHFAYSRIDQLFREMYEHAEIRDSYFSVIAYLLLSHQHSPAVFHKIVNQVPGYLKALQKSDSTTAALNATAELLHCLMFQHSGFPDLYGPIVDALKDCSRPSLDVIRRRLSECAWTKDMVLQLASAESDEFVEDCRSETGLSGLCNLGNTCYINSVLQALYMCDGFRRGVLSSIPKSSQYVLSSLQQTFAFLTYTQRKAYAPESFIKVSRPSWFGAGQQQDCSEFLRHLLNVLHDQEHAVDGNEHSAPTHSGQRTTNNDEDISSLVSKTFGGYTLTTYHCLRCRTRSSKKESFMDLQLAFPAESTTSASVGSGQMAGGSSSSICRRQEADDSITENGSGSVSLTFLLDHFLQTESLEGVNQYKCEATCGSLQDAERSTQIFSAPPYLVMTLLRFSYEGGRHTKKLTDVQYPLSIEVPLAPLNDGLHESLPRSRIYGLVGVVVHSGLSSDHGHYYCYGRRSRLLSDTSSRPVMRVEGDRDSVDYFVADWFMFNDSRVTRASFEDFRNVTQKFTRDTAYLLVYHSVDEGDADSDSSEPPLHSYLREIIDRDNERYLEELQKRRKMRQSFSSHMGHRSVYREEDDEGPPPPSNCGNGDFSSFLQGPPSIC